mgnify:CR=1 FL=1
MQSSDIRNRTGDRAKSEHIAGPTIEQYLIKY